MPIVVRTRAPMGACKIPSLNPALSSLNTARDISYIGGLQLFSNM